MKPLQGNTGVRPSGDPSTGDQAQGTSPADGLRKSRTRPPASVRARERLRHEAEQAHDVSSQSSSSVGTAHSEPSMAARRKSGNEKLDLIEQARRINSGFQGDGLDQIEAALNRLWEAGFSFDRPPLSKLVAPDFLKTVIRDVLHLTGSPYMVGRVVKRLIEMGCDPNVCDSSGQTALMHAARYGLSDLVELLLVRGSDRFLQWLNTEGQNAAMIALDSENIAIARQLVEAGVAIDPPNPAVDFYLDNLEAFKSEGNDEVCRTFLRVLRSGNYMNLADTDGRTLIFYAVLNEDIDTVTLLCNHSNYPDLQRRDHAHKSVFDYAALIEDEEVRRQILHALKTLRSTLRPLREMRIPDH